MKIRITETQYNNILKESMSQELKQDLESFHGDIEIFEGNVSEEKKEGTKLCARGKAAAKAKFDVYPSAYANGYAVQVCKGTMPDKNGEKKCSGEYCKGKNESVENLDEALDQWFDEKWVNICRKKEGGGHPPCGRKDADKGGYPKCRKTSVASKMTDAEKKSACSTKRKAEKDDPQKGKGQKPVNTKSPDSRKNESYNIDRMVITESKVIISEGLQYHLDNQISLLENVYRYGSEGYFNLINEVRELYNEGKIDLSHLDEELIKTDIGKKVIFEGREVWLDIPMLEDEVEQINEVKFRGKDVKTSSPQRSSSGGKAYKVYVSGCAAKTKSNPSGVKQIRFGSGGLKAKLNNPEAKKSYNARHGCSKGKHNDKCKAGYWSCRLPRYAKKLGLSGGGTWW
jgi:hypothetical protein